ncbi:MAG TPA: hypothetical protein ENF75_07105, partial [Acidilobales archaeon]|nr:hypothetical protein [Acidilobales archaeon]
MLLIRKALVPILVLILVISLFASVTVQAAESARSKEIVIKRIMDDATAIQEIRAGKSDGRLFRIPRALASELQAEGAAQIVISWTGMVDILLNPVPKSVTGKFNPFEYREVRFALNYLIDRSFIVNEIYKGAAKAIIAPVADIMPGYVEVLPVLGKYRFTYDFVKAYQMISEAMKKVGATKTPEGYWVVDGEVVTVKFIIRIEDERRQIGDLLADQLEKVGFKVERLYKDFMAAITLVYMTDPKDLEWHLYTEGWGFTVDRYNEYDFI